MARHLESLPILVPESQSVHQENPFETAWGEKLEPLEKTPFAGRSLVKNVDILKKYRRLRQNT